MQDLPSTSEKILLYSSSAAVVLPAPLHMRLGYNFKGYASSYTYSDEREMPPEHAAGHDYAVSKTIADKSVREAHGVRGLRTGIVSGSPSNAVPKIQSTGRYLAASSGDDHLQPERSDIGHE